MAGVRGWAPPLDPRDVVGTGHGWMEPVSVEGEHRGVDLQAYRGTPVRAPVSGVITDTIRDDQGLGQQVGVRGPDGWETRMGHLDSEFVRPGPRVGQGQQIAAVGSTGISPGPHVGVFAPDGNYT